MALQQQHWAAITHCLHAYLHVGLPQRAESTIRVVLVAPCVQDALRDVKGKQSIGTWGDCMVQPLQVEPKCFSATCVQTFLILQAFESGQSLPGHVAVLTDDTLFNM